MQDIDRSKIIASEYGFEFADVSDQLNVFPAMNGGDFLQGVKPQGSMPSVEIRASRPPVEPALAAFRPVEC